MRPSIDIEHAPKPLESDSVVANEFPEFVLDLAHVFVGLPSHASPKLPFLCIFSSQCLVEMNFSLHCFLPIKLLEYFCEMGLEERVELSPIDLFLRPFAPQI